MIELFTINAVSFCILGIPAYFFCTTIGFVITTCVYIMLMSSKKYDISQGIKIFYISILGVILGAKLFGFLSGIYRNIGMHKAITINTLLDTGIVFYGGLFGIIVGYLICLKIKYQDIDKHIVDILGVCIPLFHSIGRIGCFLSGCCYGKRCNGMIAINYITVINDYVNESRRFPIQLVEALFEFIVFIYLLFLLKSNEWKSKKLLIRYLVIYSFARFFFEFLRGDIRRGIIYGISFSQCISVFIWMIVLFFYIKQHILKREDYNG